MPNHRRNQNSRHSNNQRNRQNDQTISAQSVSIVQDVVVEAEAFVDYSDEIELLKSSLESMRKGYNKQQKQLSKLKKDYDDVDESNQNLIDCLKVLKHKYKIIDVNFAGGKSVEVTPKCLITGDGTSVEFKDIPKLVHDKNTEIRNLKSFCKSLLEKNQDAVKKACKDLNSQITKDDLVCDINYSDEESDEEEDFMSHTKFRSRGKHYSYNKKHELYDDDFQFIGKFNCVGECFNAAADLHFKD